MLVGLTGGFGSGKSTVLRIFKDLGATVLSADAVVHEALRRREVRKSVVDIFGPGILSGGEIDRRKLSAEVFSDEEKRKRLEELLHPIVLETIREAYGAMNDGVMIVEIPLLFEAGFEKEVDRVIAVRADADVVVERLRAKGFSEEEIRRRSAAQMPVEEKASRADYLIDNSGTLKETEREVKRVWEDLSRG